MRKSLALLKRFAREENGASMVEYAVLIGIITAALVGILTTFGTEIGNEFTDISTVLQAD